MNRRQLFGALLALPAVSLDPRTAAERKAGVTPVDIRYAEGDVRRYGARGDGIHDDTKALQAFFQARNTHLSGGAYRISGRVAVGHLEGVRIEHCTIISAGNHWPGVCFDGCRDLTLSHIQFVTAGGVGS